ncbi:hypothetical protein Tco_0435344, partial [Tanacetum coccineum]
FVADLRFRMDNTLIKRILAICHVVRALQLAAKLHKDGNGDRNGYGETDTGKRQHPKT